MVRVLVVEPDPLLREALELMLDEAGYTVAGVGDGNLARQALRVSPYPLVVLLSRSTDRIQAAEDDILRGISDLPAHAYLLLSMHPHHAPWVWNAHTERFVPVVPVPFDVDEVLDRVANAAGLLGTVASSHWPALASTASKTL